MPKDAAFSQVTRCLNCTAAYSQQAEQCVWEAAQDQGRAVPCALAPRQDFDYMGYSIRTGEWRYTVFCAWLGQALRGDWGNCSSAELYEHTGQAGVQPLYRPEGEVSNVVGLPQNAQVVAALHSRLQAQFGGRSPRKGYFGLSKNSRYLNIFFNSSARPLQSLHRRARWHGRLSKEMLTRPLI